MWESLVNGFLDPRFQQEPWRTLLPIGFIGLALLTLGLSLSARALVLFLDPSARAAGSGVKGLGVTMLQGLVVWGTTLALTATLAVFAAAYYEASQRLPATGVLYRNPMERQATMALFVSVLVGGGTLAMRAITDAARLHDWFNRRRTG